MEQNKFTQKMNKNLEETFDETQCNKFNTMVKSEQAFFVKFHLIIIFYQF